MAAPKTARPGSARSSVKSLEREVGPVLAGGRASSSELAERTRRLARLGQALLEVAHQVRGPLGAIHLYARLLGQQQGTPPRAPHLVRRILTGVVGLSALLEDLFLFAETDTLRREPCYLLDALEPTLDFAEPYLREKGVRVTRLYVGELDVVQADARLLSSVFLNITLNAVQAMPKGGELTVILRAALRPGAGQEVRFEDTGPGFSRPAREHLFEPFYTEKQTGLGLGLAVAYRIVKAHGGLIEVANRAQGGAAVTVRVPAG